MKDIKRWKRENWMHIIRKQLWNILQFFIKFWTFAGKTSPKNLWSVSHFILSYLPMNCLFHINDQISNIHIFLLSSKCPFISCAVALSVIPISSWLTRVQVSGRLNIVPCRAQQTSISPQLYHRNKISKVEKSTAQMHDVLTWNLSFWHL